MSSTPGAEGVQRSRLAGVIAVVGLRWCGIAVKPNGSSSRHAELLALADELRPELHRYCARLMGSVIEGEDVVQDTFARAFVAVDELEEMAPLRAWLFRYL